MTYDAAELARLREIAQKATPGPWVLGDKMSYGRDLCLRGVSGGTGGWFVELHDFANDAEFESNAAHIAAFDPLTVLSLIAALEKAQGERDEALEAVAFQNKVIVSGALKVNEARTELDSARALLREIVKAMADAKGALSEFGEPYTKDAIEHASLVLGEALARYAMEIAQ